MRETEGSDDLRRERERGRDLQRIREVYADRVSQRAESFWGERRKLTGKIKKMGQLGKIHELDLLLASVPVKLF